jgi:hypothetical protein
VIVEEKKWLDDEEFLSALTGDRRLIVPFSCVGRPGATCKKC